MRCVLVMGLARLVTGSTMDEVESQVDQRRQNIHFVDSLDLMLYLTLLALTILTLWVFKKKRLKFIHESGLSVLLGLVVGAILRYSGTRSPLRRADVRLTNPNITYLSGPPDLLRINLTSHGLMEYSLQGAESGSRSSQVQQGATFDSELFFYVILPPIIFHAGYSMRKKHFFDNLGSILTFALPGTLISTLLVSSLMWLVLQLTSLQVRFLDTLYFGAIISATDPVTSLAIFSDLHVDPLLSGLMLGESLLNDAVAIVMVGAIEDYSLLYLKGDPDTFEVEAFFRTIGNFFAIFLGSVGLGSLLGLITALLTKFTRIRDYPLLETSLFFILSYASYLLAEVCQMSGIVSVLFCGIFQAHYTFHNLSLESKQRTRQLFELLNFLLENFIFSYIGVSMFTFTEHHFHVGFIFGAFLAIAVARAANIYPMSFLLNLGRHLPIPLNYQHMMVFSGLRGAMAFALAMRNTTTVARRMFLTATSLISIVTVVFCGGMTGPLLSLLKIPVGVPPTDPLVVPEANNELERGGGSNTLTPGLTPSSHKSLLARKWKNVDKILLKPLLTNSQPTLQETLPWLGRLAVWLTPLEQMEGTGSRTNQDGDLVDESDTERDENSLTSGD